MMDSIVLMTLVDKWRPESQTFHLSCGETKMMLQDIVMILGLPIEGTPVCRSVCPGGWRDNVGPVIGIRPPPPHVVVDQQDKK
jgi:hypothetical protein